MELIKIPEVRLEYPIGLHIRTNYTGFSMLINYFIDAAHERIMNIEYISLICRGSSGAIAASFYYIKLTEKYPHLKDITICHVKKEGECSHSKGLMGLFRSQEKDNVLYVLVDDFSNTGSTLYACYEAMLKEMENDFLFDYIILKYTSERANKRMEITPITKVLISKVI